MADGWVDFWLDDTDSPVIDCEAFISKLVAEKRLDGFDLAPEENEFVRLGKAEEMRQAISSAVKAGRLKLRDRGGHVSHSGLPRRDDYGPWTGVFFERAEFLAFARDEWSIRQGPPESAADIHESRYQAIGDDARFALFNVAELTAWASANKVAIPFLKLLVTDEHTDTPSERRFQPCGTLPLLIATAYVPVDMDPHEAKGELFASGDAADDGDPVGRLRGRIAASYERHLLNAVYDGKLTIYGRSDYAPIDLTAARLRWKEKSTPRTPQEAPEEPKTTSQGAPSTPVSEVPTHHVPTEQSPAPLATPVIASAFDGIYSWSANQWSKALGDGRTLWLNKARKSKGRPGVGPATWSPITIALGLRDKGVGWVALDSVFKKAALREWREQWERETEILRD